MNWISPAILRHKRIDPGYYAPEHLRTEAWIEEARRNVSFAPLGDFARLWSGPFGSKLPSSLYRVSGPYPLYRSQNVKPFWVETNGLVYLEKAAFNDLKSCSATVGDILVSKAGFVGTTCIIGQGQGPAIITEHVLAVRPKDRTDRYYLLATLNSSICKKQLEREGLGTILDYLGVEVSRELLVPRPEDNLQRAIGHKVRAAERLRAAAAQAKVTINEWLAKSLPAWEEPTEQLPVTPTFNGEFSEERLDSWYNHPQFQRLEEALSQFKLLVPLSSIARTIGDRWNGTTGEIEYIEIGEFDLAQGVAVGRVIDAAHAPSRAQIAARLGDLAVSLVRPNRKNIVFLQGSGRRPIVVTSGCDVLRFADADTAALYSIILRHNTVTHQIMRWNTGSSYPAIEQLPSATVLIPPIPDAKRQELLESARFAVTGVERAKEMTRMAIADVEILIDGKLDEAACLEQGCQLAQEFGFELP